MHETTWNSCSDKLASWTHVSEEFAATSVPGLLDFSGFFVDFCGFPRQLPRKESGQDAPESLRRFPACLCGAPPKAALSVISLRIS